MDALLKKLNKLTNWQTAVILAVVGFAVFCTGLGNPFQGDDIAQIVSNPVVHSVSHLKLFFEGGTFYKDGGIAPLSGDYYRPLMTTAFALLYTLFGPHAFYFHLFQVLVCVSSAGVLYLFLKRYFGSLLALVLALIFLVHPLNSQVVFAIPSMQDALFFFFGITALYLLQRHKSTRSLWLVATCLFLSLLSKESGVYFVGVALLYLFWFSKERLYKFAGMMAVPAIAYLALKAHAVGLFIHSAGYAPIDNLNLANRLLTAPSIMQFYVTKSVFPWKLATAYYWTYPTFSFRHFVVPLLIDIAVIAFAVYAALLIRRKAGRSQQRIYLFFAAWAGIGLLGALQIIPLDMTACEDWFYFSMAGVLGMIGVVLTTWQERIKPQWFVVVVVLVIGSLGLRTALRGTDYRSQYVLSMRDVAASKEDYNAYNNLAHMFDSQGNYQEAKAYALQSLAIYPAYYTYSNLGVALQNLGDYQGAAGAYKSVLKYGGDSRQLINGVDDRLGALTLVSGDYASNQSFLLGALQEYPQDSQLWLYLAIVEDAHGNAANAKTAIQNATKYGEISPVLYDDIMANQPFTLDLDIGKTVSIQ